MRSPITTDRSAKIAGSFRTWRSERARAATSSVSERTSTLKGIEPHRPSKCFKYFRWNVSKPPDMPATKTDKKIQRTGGGTPYVYLPKDWTGEVFPEDRVVIQKLPLGLFLTPPVPAVAAAEYSVKSNQSEVINEAILAAYTQGHRVISIGVPTMGARATAEVSGFASRLMGVVSNVTSDQVVLKEYAEHERVDLARLVEALFSKCKEMAISSKELLATGGDVSRKPEEILGLLDGIEDDADFLSFGLFRLLSSRSRYVEVPGELLVDLLYYSVINYAAERYCDCLQGMADAYRLLLAEGRDGRKALTAVKEAAFIPGTSAKYLDRAREVVIGREGVQARVARKEIRGTRLNSWEPSVGKLLHHLVASDRATARIYPAMRVCSRLLESGTYLESFFSRTSQFFFSGPPVLR